MRQNAAGNSVVEYTVLLAVVAAALVSMAIYMKRGVSGQLRKSMDSVGEQYDPRHTTSLMVMTTRTDMTTVSTLTKDRDVGVGLVDVLSSTTSINNGQDVSDRSGVESVGPLGTDLWQ